MLTLPESMNIPADLKREIVELFSKMDAAYADAAGKADFACTGCKDNCCLTRFYHHTLIELLYLHGGLTALPRPHRQQIRARAETARRKMADLEYRGKPVRVMCPINELGRCVLYAHRPMICRLHGIPNVMNRPDGRVISGPGCDAYYLQCPDSRDVNLDRTPLYTAMADIERRLRDRLGFRDKVKLTVAEMILI